MKGLCLYETVFIEICGECIKERQKQNIFRRSITKTEHILNLIHLNLKRLFSHTFRGETFFLNINNDVINNI